MKSFLPVLIVGVALGSAARADTDSFKCQTSDPGRAISISGKFEGKIPETATGSVSIDFPERAMTVKAEKVEFVFMTWTSTRMNFYLRDEKGEVATGVLIENYLGAPIGQKLDAALYGEFGQRKLTCERTGEAN